MMENFLSKYLERVRRIECHLARVKKGNEEERARLQAVLEPVIKSSTNDTKISKLLTVLTTLIVSFATMLRRPRATYRTAGLHLLHYQERSGCTWSVCHDGIEYSRCCASIGGHVPCP